jgi:hypothetical protein
LYIYFFNAGAKEFLPTKISRQTREKTGGDSRRIFSSFAERSEVKISGIKEYKDK